MLKLVLLVAQLVAFVFGAALLPEDRLDVRDLPKPPSEDPFYTPDKGYEKEEPGTILRWRHAPQLPAFTVFKDKVEASIQILYRTTDTQGNATATVVSVLIPHNHAVGKILAYQSWENSAWINCSPSYAIQLGANPQGIVSQVDILTLQAALNEGWIVTTADYEGPKSSYTSGIISGQATLDSIRATLKSENITGVKPDSNVVLWGYSGGSIAAGWAAALQPTYAPELKIAGAALGGVIRNLTSAALTVNRGPFAGLVPTAISGLSTQYPELDAYINEQLIPAKRAYFETGKNQCVPLDATLFAFQDWTSYFKDGQRVLYNDVAQKVLEENTMGKQKPKIPLLFYHSVLDEIEPVHNVDELYDEYCSNGVTVEYYRETAAEHVVEMITGFPTAFNYIKDLLDGGSVKAGCQRHDILTHVFDANALPSYWAELWAVFKQLLGAPIGPQSVA
uniref:ARAD1D14784p n=1 Tax=Blastobotrys adeninivorans TaxID=409370 RepID=A0A060T9V7_BLAAD